VGLAVLPVGAAEIVVAAAFGLDAWNWDHWQDALSNLAKAIIKDVGYRARSSE
jgi:hypothetical protein